MLLGTCASHVTFGKHSGSFDCGSIYFGIAVIEISKYLLVPAELAKASFYIEEMGS